MIDEQHHPKLTDCQARLLPLGYFSLEFLAQREQPLLSPPMDFSIEALEVEKKRDQQAFFLKAMRRGSVVCCACIGLCLCLHGSSSCVYLSSWPRLTGGWHFNQVDCKVNLGNFCWQHVCLFCLQTGTGH